MELISSILGGIVDLLVWLIQSIFGSVAWVVREIWDLLKKVLDFYIRFIVAYPGVTAIVFLVFLVLYFAWWGIYKKTEYTPRAFWQKPGFVLAILYPLVCAIFGLVLDISGK